MGRDTWKKGFSKPLNVKISVAFPLGDSPASLKAIGTCDIRLQSNVTLEYRPSAAPGLFLKKKKKHSHQKASLPAVWKVAVQPSLNCWLHYLILYIIHDKQGTTGLLWLILLSLTQL